MYRKATKGWVKHIDFTLIELACLFISLLIASTIRHGNRGFAGFWDQYSVLVYIMLATNFILSIILHFYNKILRRGRLRELGETVKLIFFTWAISLGGLYMAHIAGNYSRVVNGYVGSHTPGVDIYHQTPVEDGNQKNQQPLGCQQPAHHRITRRGRGSGQADSRR